MFKEHWYRFPNLFLFFVQHCVLGSIFTGITPIANSLQEKLNYDIELVSFSVSLLLMTTIVFTILNTFFLQKIGLKIANVIFCFLTLLGIYVRTFMTEHINYLLLAYVIIGIANAYVLNA